MLVVLSILGYLATGGLLAMLFAYHGAWPREPEGGAVAMVLVWPAAMWVNAAALANRRGESKRAELAAANREYQQLLQKHGIDY